MGWRKGRLEAWAFGIEAQVTSEGRGGNRKEKHAWETEEKSPCAWLLPGCEGRRVWRVRHCEAPRLPPEASRRPCLPLALSPQEEVEGPSTVPGR